MIGGYVVVWTKEPIGGGERKEELQHGYDSPRAAGADMATWWELDDDGYRAVSATVVAWADLTLEQQRTINQQRSAYRLPPLPERTN